MRSLNSKERKAAFALLAGLCLIQIINDWYIRGMQFGWELPASTLAWLCFFYWLPFALLLFADNSINTQLSWRNIRLWGLYFTSMLLGILLVNISLSLLFSGYSMSLFTLIFSSFLWSLFNFTLYRFFILYKTLQVERINHKQSQLNTLKQQLNPHFLFNSLNTVSAFVHDQPHQAEDAIQNLADILRYSLDMTEKDKVSIAEDVETLKRYLALEQARFGDKLSVSLDISPESLDKLIPPMLLQPVVENCIKHTQHWPLIVTIEISLKDDNQLNLVVRDNGGGMVINENENKPHGHGLRITRHRIALSSEANIHFNNVTTSEQQGLQVTMELNA
jgi:two-component sensor histidine kinase